MGRAMADTRGSTMQCAIWRMVNVIGLAAACTCLLSPVSCLTADAQEMKVGYVDVAKLFDNYERTKTSDAALEGKGKQKEAELEGRVNELKKLRQSLELLNDKAREARAREIEEKADELQRFRNNTARDLRRERDQIAKQILDEIQHAIQEYAKARGYTFIFDERVVLFGQPGDDVTNEVLKFLNKS